VTRLDLLYIADLRFPGGTTSALINDLRAARHNDLTVGVLAIHSSALSMRRPPNEKLVGWMRKLGVPLVPQDERIETPLALIYHPSILNTLPPRKLDIDADQVGLVAHHPLTDATGALQFKYDELRHLTRHLLGRDLLVLPVGPKVRETFVRAGHSAQLHDSDWSNLISLEDWPVVMPRSKTDRLRIGRHSRPDWLKWPAPEAAALIYPDDPAFEFSMLGVDENLRQAFPEWPAHWAGLPFRASGVRDYLAGLDVYSYFHHPNWIEAFGYNVLEALACGLPTILAPDFEPTFGKAALYAQPHDAADLYRDLLAEPSKRKAQGKRAREFVKTHHSYDSFKPRYEALTKGASPAPKLLRSRIVPKRSSKVMVITSNGVGSGHIVRQLAIAKALPFGVETTFFSMSKSVKFAAGEGFMSEYRAFHRQTGSDVESWNNWLCDELMEAFAFYGPDAVIFDGNMPYAGLVNAMQAYPEMSRIWVRRGMWRNLDKVAKKRADFFHLVVTPGELAEASDPGHGISDDPMGAKVAPILSVHPDELFSKQTARRMLGLPPDKTLCLLQLGGGANFDMGAARALALETVLSDGKSHVVELVSPARMDAVELQNDRHHVVTVFPAFLYSKAFDFAIGAAGYNGFHETIAGALPSLLVPNSAGEMDLQETRANYAARAGWALTARADDVYRLADQTRRICADTGLRDQMRDRMQSLSQDWSGAQQAADLISVAAQTCPLQRAMVTV
jgi:UDP:flavonoid glycosyltransferase YjiC (YdhE family)